MPLGRSRHETEPFRNGGGPRLEQREDQMTVHDQTRLKDRESDPAPANEFEAPLLLADDIAQLT